MNNKQWQALNRQDRLAGVLFLLPSVWGVVGYNLLALGALAEAGGIPAGLYASVPGGLFELVLGIRLLTGRGGHRS